MELKLILPCLSCEAHRLRERARSRLLRKAKPTADFVKNCVRGPTVNYPPLDYATILDIEFDNNLKIVFATVPYIQIRSRRTKKALFAWTPKYRFNFHFRHSVAETDKVRSCDCIRR